MNRIIKSIIGILISIILGICSQKEALASILITINSYPSGVIAGQEFEVGFMASGVSVSSNYYGKSLGGESFTKVDTNNSGGWYQQNSAWANMPQFTSNSQGSVSGTIKSKFDTDITAGLQQFKIRIRKVDDDTNYDSEIVNINVTLPTPSPLPSPTPSPIPTQTPNPQTPTPTKTPGLTPTKSSFPIPTPIRTSTDGIASATEGQAKTLSVLSENTEKIEPVNNPTEVKKTFPVFAVVIIVAGFVLIGVSGYLTYKIRYNDDNDKKN